MEHLQQAILWLIDTYGYVGLFVALALGNIGGADRDGDRSSRSGSADRDRTFEQSLADDCRRARGRAGRRLGRIRDRPLRRRAADRAVRKVRSFHARPAVGACTASSNAGERLRSSSAVLCRFCGASWPLPPGIAEMNLAHFYLWTFLGSLIFCGLLILLGNALGAHLVRGASAAASRRVSHPRLRRRCVVAGIVVMRARSRPLRAR